jgi:hypothetical protein
VSDILRANQPFSVTLSNGVPVNVNTGDLWASDDPLVKGREALFGPVEVRNSAAYGRARLDVDTETADATPGTRRAPVRRRGVDTPSPKNGEDERPADAQPPALAQPLDDDTKDSATKDSAKPGGKPVPKGGGSGA